MSLDERVRSHELMDDPRLDRGRHEHALEALGRVNGVSFGAARVWREVRRLEREGLSEVSVLDVACGGGDVLLGVARRAGGRDAGLRLHGCDASPVALDVARRGAADRPPGGGVRLTFERMDVTAEPLPSGFDLVCTSLFLHHLSDEGAILLLEAMAAAAERAVLVQDLRRTRLGLAFAFVGLRALTRSEVARADGLASVRAAFTIDEARRLSTRAGLRGAEVRGCWPQRFTIRWRRPAAGTPREGA